MARTQPWQHYYAINGNLIILLLLPTLYPFRFSTTHASSASRPTVTVLLGMGSANRGKLSSANGNKSRTQSVGSYKLLPQYAGHRHKKREIKSVHDGHIVGRYSDGIAEIQFANCSKVRVSRVHSSPVLCWVEHS